MSKVINVRLDSTKQGPKHILGNVKAKETGKLSPE